MLSRSTIARSLRLVGVIGSIALALGVLTSADAAPSTVKIQSFSDRIQFHAQTGNVEELKLAILDLSGAIRYESSWTQGRSLSWSLKTDGGDPVANGVYLYMLRMKDAQGYLERDVGKLAVMDGKLRSVDRSPQTRSLAHPRSNEQVRAQAQTFNEPLEVNTSNKFGFELNMSGGSSGRFRIAHDSNAGFNLVKKAANNPKQVFAFAVFEDGSQNLFTIFNNTTGNLALGIDGNNNVGIGIRESNAKVHINNGFNQTALRIDSGSGTNAIEVRNAVTISGAGLASDTDAVFRVERSNGDVFTDGTYHCGQSGSEPGTCIQQDSFADFAEMLPSETGLGPGDLLALGPDGQLQKSNTAYRADLIGVYSTRPSYLGHAEHLGDARHAPLAITGIVPVKVTPENGEISPGDPITSSSRPGYGMRALRAGRIIGHALEATNETGTIRVLVQPEYYQPKAPSEPMRDKASRFIERNATPDHRALEKTERINAQAQQVKKLMAFKQRQTQKIKQLEQSNAEMKQQMKSLMERVEELEQQVENN